MNNAKLKFDKLTPINKADLNIYNQAFDFIFKDDEIKNVAISGPYGAGKSSLLETYKSIHGEKKFIHISLAHFEDKDIAKAATNAFTKNTKKNKKEI